MIFYDEDAFFGSGEIDILTVFEVREFLTKNELKAFNSLVNKSLKRKHKAELKSSRGYKEARKITNSYRGKYHHKSSHSYGSRYKYYESDVLEEAYNDCIAFEYLGG